MRLAIVGTGLIVQTLLPHIRDFGWEPVAICASKRSGEAAKTLAEQHRCPAVYTDYERMLSQVEADAVYLGVPNHLHFHMGRQALMAGWNVILEKPITGSFREAERLAALAKEKGRFLYEAITTLYQPDYAALREQLNRIGTVKLVSCNFSQYSSRYDGFLRGETPPVFDPARAGGALMDLNLYNIHWLLGLFGVPDRAEYLPTLERGIDTSGVLLMAYPGFQAVSIASKSSSAPSQYRIQGTRGYLEQNTPANECGQVTLCLKDGTREVFHTPTSHRMEMEFRAFAGQMKAGDLASCYAALDHSLSVSKLMTQARIAAGINFPCDIPSDP